MGHSPHTNDLHYFSNQNSLDHPVVKEFLEKNKTRFICNLCKGNHHIYFCPRLTICFRFNAAPIAPKTNCCVNAVQGKTKSLDEFSGSTQEPAAICNPKSPLSVSEIGNDPSSEEREKTQVDLHTVQGVEKENCPCDKKCPYQHICAYCGESDHNSLSCPSRRKFCTNFNSISGCKRLNCNFDHVCSVCGVAGHTVNQCLLKFKSRHDPDEPWSDTNWKTPDTPAVIKRRQNREICQNYNSKTGCTTYNCNYLDICLICRGFHPAFLCLSMKNATCFVYNAVSKNQCKCDPHKCRYIHKCFLCGEEHGSPNCFHRDKYCNKFNHPNQVCEHPKCTFPHVCKTCEGNHSAMVCPFNYRPLNRLKVLGEGFQGHQMQKRDWDSMNMYGHSGLNHQNQMHVPEPHQTGPWGMQGHGQPNPRQKMTKLMPHLSQLPKNEDHLPSTEMVLSVNRPDGTLIEQMKYSIVINGVRWSGVLTREDGEE